MRVLIVGAAGMVGRKLAQRLARDGMIAGKPLDRLELVDVVEPVRPKASMPITAAAADISDPAVAGRLLASRPDVVFHLAAIVSGEAEADFDKGYRVNLDATRHLLEAARAISLRTGGTWRTKFVFASSIAVFGAPFPDPIPDEFFAWPLTSYGTQKAIAELLVNDYSRRGFVDGASLRLPTICVRPGAPKGGGG